LIGYYYKFRDMDFLKLEIPTKFYVSNAPPIDKPQDAPTDRLNPEMLTNLRAEVDFVKG
jgi:hypothetical protein